MQPRLGMNVQDKGMVVEGNDPYLMMYFLEEPWQGSGRGRGRGRDRDGEGQERIMHCRVWGQFPSELVERVLLMLPAAVQARFKLVCRSWRSLLSCSRFREETVSMALTCRPLSLCFISLYLERPCRLHQLVPDRYKLYRHLDWHHLKVDLGFLPHKFRSSLCKLPHCFGGYGATRGGLVCLQDFLPRKRSDRDRMGLCVVNLVNRTWTEVPPLSLPRGRVHELGELVGAGGGAEFHITLLFQGISTTSFAKYSSSAGEWTICELRDRVIRQIDRIATVASAVCTGGRVYVLYMLKSAHCVLVLFNSDDGSWVAGGRLALGIGIWVRPYLFQHGGRLLWIRACPSPEMPPTVTIWAMVESNNLETPLDAEQISVMPQWLLPGRMKWRLDHAQLAGDTILLLFKSLKLQESQTVGFKLVERSWQYLTPDRLES